MKGMGMLASAGALVLGGRVAAALVSRVRAGEYDFKGRAVVITGGSRGLGLLIARELAAQGARLALLARDRDELQRAASDLAASGAEVLTLPCDVRDRDVARQAIEQVVSRFGQIDVLINNAGIISVGPVENMALADFEDAIATHTFGPLYTMLAAMPHMRRQGGGRIVNIASIGGKIAVPHLTPYTTSKFALVGLSDAMRAELAKDGIAVTTVCPGLMRTGSHVNAYFKGWHEAEFAAFALSNALPTNSIAAGRAARLIVAACRRGDPHLTITLQARLLAALTALAPTMMARGAALVARLLPGPNATDGDEPRTGWQSQSRWAPSPLTFLADKEIAKNNEARPSAGAADRQEQPGYARP